MALSVTCSGVRCSSFASARTEKPVSSLLPGPALLSSRSPFPSFLRPLSTGNLPHRGPRGVTVMSMEAGIGVMGTKLGMMTYFEPDGTVVPVTVVGFREGNIVTQVKTAATDGYDAVQVAYRRVRDRKLTKPELGHLEKAGAIPMRHLQEFRLQSVDGFEPGQRLVIEDIFKEGDLVDVSGNSIGKGFQDGSRSLKSEVNKGVHLGNLRSVTTLKIRFRSRGKEVILRILAIYG
ncbi:large ribosomal subunit protein uL3c-like [Curcuma longa]|uniref:large ribosomal subunit protein uL3c-like n=1 Tax=Curcuma longa TaxID=136217 RepID=UPI003D9E8DE0